MTFLQQNPILIVLAVIAFVILLTIVRRIFVNVGAREIAIKERRYFGRKMPPGRVVATEGEVGIQADVLKPGLHLIKWPFEKVVRKVPLIEIGSDEIGIIEAVDGEPAASSRLTARRTRTTTFKTRLRSLSRAASRASNCARCRRGCGRFTLTSSASPSPKRR